jgi:N-dimethylarginine dimethylaminohydrolase
MTIQNGWAALRRVLVRPPQSDDHHLWARYGWRAAPDPSAAAAEHEAFRMALADAGADVQLISDPVPGDPDAIYAYDPALLTDRGAILLAMGKSDRRAEPATMGRALERLDVPTLATLERPAAAEGGDMFWLDEATLLIGMGYRTNELGAAEIRRAVGPLAEVITVDLPHRNGPSECLHLMSLLSPLDRDLATAFLPLMPVRLVTLLHERGVALIEVPEDEFDSMGPNVLALAPRVALALDGNNETRRRMERAGVDVRTYIGNEISRKGDGGPTCLTRPLDRG